MPADTTNLEYEKLPNNIHRFTFHTSDRNAIDAFIISYTEILSSQDHNKPVKFLIDFRPSGVPSITYSYARLRKLFSEYGPDLPPIYAAYLHDDSPLLSIAQTFLDMLRIPVKRRFLHGPGEEAEIEAMQWLESVD